jgi:MazG family protein
MRRRHPHVYGGAEVSGSAEVRRNWQKIKQQERKGDARGRSALDSVPAGLPALMRAHAVSERAAGSRFDWEGLAGVMQKVEEELAEFREALAQENPERRLAEFGDVLFTLVNVARFCALDSETALLLSTRKFERRFRAMEQIVRESGRELPAVPQEEKDRIWERVKSL